MGNQNILNILQHLWILSNIYSCTILLICNIVTKNSNILILRLQLYCDNDIIMNIISGLNIVLRYKNSIYIISYSFGARMHPQHVSPHIPSA